MPTLIVAYLHTWAAQARHRLHPPRGHDPDWLQRDRGSSAEVVVLIALFVVLAIGAVAVIAAKVMARANSIDLGGTTG
jgi:hypothetical protein